MKIKIYGKEDCPWCDKAKEFLDAAGFEYDYFNLDANILGMLKDLKEWNKKVPAIFINEKYVGGYSDMIELAKQGEYK